MFPTTLDRVAIVSLTWWRRFFLSFFLAVFSRFYPSGLLPGPFTDPEMVNTVDCVLKSQFSMCPFVEQG